MKQPFKPEMLPITSNISRKELLLLTNKASKANALLAKFNEKLEHSPIKEEMIMLFSLNEAVESTKIEGTQVTFDEALEAGIAEEITKNTQEVLNYREALKEGVELLKRYPLSTRVFLELHKILLKNSRGENRSPGEYRKIQNFIGKSKNIEEATYIPPEPQYVPEYIKNLEEYINDVPQEDKIAGETKKEVCLLDPIIKSGIIHAQFETIHPFLDGNGRLGRILIILYLLDKKVINKPTFFISEELEKNKFKYYACLNSLRTNTPDWFTWLDFYLDSAIRQSNFYIHKLERVEELLQEMLDIAERRNIQRKIIYAIFKQPLFKISNLKEELGMNYNTIKNNIDKLIEEKKIYPDDKKRNKVFRFYDLIDILR
jgi:Fic family protein